MTIGLVLPAVPGYSETFFRSKIEGLVQAGHKVLLFAGGEDKGFDLCKVVPHPNVYRLAPLQAAALVYQIIRLLVMKPLPASRFYQLERQAGRSMKAALENLYLNSHILRCKLDWLHFGFATTSLRRENAARAIQARMAVSLRGYDIALYPLKHPGCYQLLWQRVDKVHTISDDLLTLAYREGLPVTTPVQKITPAIDTRQFQRKQPLSNRLDPPLQILTVARLHWKKGLEYTLEALALLKKAGIDFRYTLIGTGEENERLVFAAHQLGIREQVHFAGKLPHVAVKAAMESSDIYLQYSISEGFCNAVLEAQAMGLLCIVSDAEGLPENVLHGQTGWVVPKRQPKLLCQQLLTVIHHPHSALIMIRQNAMERIQRNFNLEKPAIYQSHLVLSPVPKEQFRLFPGFRPTG